MYKVIHCDEPLVSTYGVAVRVPAVYENSDVMVPVQKNQFLFSQHNEVSICKLRKFGEAEKKGPQAWSSKLDGVITDAPLPSITDEVLEVWPSCNGKPGHAEDGQSEAPQKEGRSQVVLLSVSHPTLDSKYTHHVESRDIYRKMPVLRHKRLCFVKVKPLFYSH